MCVRILRIDLAAGIPPHGGAEVEGSFSFGKLASSLGSGPSKKQEPYHRGLNTYLYYFAGSLL